MQVEDGGLAARATTQSEVVLGDFFDQCEFRNIDGLILLDPLVKLVLEVFGFLGRQDEFLGAQTMLDGILPRAFLAFGGLGSGGLAGVVAVDGGAALSGGHGNLNGWKTVQPK